MPHLIRFATPPMIARRLRQDIEAACPDHCLSPPSTHLEMFESARHFGLPGDDAAITVSAYPQLLERIWSDGAPAADLSVLGLPPLRREWVDLGLMPPSPTLRVIAVVPLVLAVRSCFAPFVRDWDDLHPLLRAPGRIAAPPMDTPLPFLLAAFLAARWDMDPAEVLAVLDCQSPPLEINKRLGRGELAAGLLPPAFCRNFREGEAVMVWPESGALAVPVMAAMRGDAPEETQRAFAFLLSSEIQTLLSENGGMGPAASGIGGFAELDAAGWNLIWPGWEALLAVGRAMNAHLAVA